MKSMYWASRKMKEGIKVRRNSWVENAYVYLNEHGDLMMGWVKTKVNDVRFKVDFKDINALDWEEFTF